MITENDIRRIVREELREVLRLLRLSAPPECPPVETDFIRACRNSDIDREAREAAKIAKTQCT
jgi:hypothetical protein